MRRRNCILIVVLLSLISSIGYPQEAAAVEAPPPNPLQLEVSELKEDLDGLRSKYFELRDAIESLEGPDRIALEEERQRLVLSSLDVVYRLVENLRKQEEENLETSELREYTVELLAKVPVVINRAIENLSSKVGGIQKEKGNASFSEQGIIEEELGRIEAKIDELYEIMLENLKVLDTIGEDSSELRERYTRELRLRAQLVAGRIKHYSTELQVLNNRAKVSPEDVDLLLRINAIQVSLKNGTEGLERITKLIEPLGIDVNSYKALLVSTTGDITRGLDANVLWNLASRGRDSFVEWASKNLPSLFTKIVLFGIIFYAFHLFAKLVKKGTSKALKASKIDISRLLSNMLEGVSYNLILALGILIGLSQVGVSLGPLLTGIGVLGFIVGFALQDTLGNFASGMMILFYRPFDEGDYIEAAGVSGKVSKMSLVATTILTFDYQTLIIPNGKIWGDVIRNVTHQNIRRIDLKIGVAYDSNVSHVEKVLLGLAEKHEKTLDQPEVLVNLHELGDSSVIFFLRPWVKTADYWEVYWDLMREIKIQLDAEGITIPFPQQDVHHHYPQEGGSIHHSS